MLFLPIQLLAQLKVSADGHYLTEQDGTPVLLVGSAPWDINNLTYAEARRYADSCYTHKINYWQVRMMSPAEFGGPANAYGVNPWQGEQGFGSTPTEAFWAHLDSVIEYAHTKNIYVMLYPDYLGATPSQGWSNETSRASLDEMHAWGQYVGARYADATNILWSLAGDNDPTPYQAKINALAEGIRTQDKIHLMSTRDRQGTTTNTYWSSYSWVNLRGTYPLGQLSSGIDLC